MDHSAFNILVDKYLTDSITPQEEKELLAALESETFRDLLRRTIDARADEMSYSDAEDVRFREASYEKLEGAIRALETRPLKKETKPLKNIWRFAAAAAAVILIVGAGVYFFARPVRPARMAAGNPAAAQSPARVVPGGNKAILLLANGQTILLDSAHNGLLARQGATRVLKLDSGELRYQEARPGEAVGYNTISTPRGGQYHLVLPDGTKVWLNAASSLKFPTSFPGGDRVVTMTGEVYFEVAPDVRQPFRVQVGGMTVDVLGTHFDVMAYGDESAVKTTLVQGSVKVSQRGDARLLQPGEQAVIDNASGALSVRDADVDQAIAWKNGYFEFENMDLPTIMRQISRWYDVDIRYLGKDRDERFGGGISRRLDLPEVLHLLETNGVRFRLESRTLFVTP